MEGKINIRVHFPVICIENGYYWVGHNLRDITTNYKKFIKQRKIGEYYYLDSKGMIFKQIDVEFLKFTNVFKGFTIAGNGFGMSYLDVKLKIENTLNTEQLKDIGNYILHQNKSNFRKGNINYKKIKSEFEGLFDKEDILRYIFYFLDTHSYAEPSLKDENWREKDFRGKRYWWSDFIN